MIMKILSIQGRVDLSTFIGILAILATLLIAALSQPADLNRM